MWRWQLVGLQTTWWGSSRVAAIADCDCVTSLDDLTCEVTRYWQVTWHPNSSGELTVPQTPSRRLGFSSKALRVRLQSSSDGNSLPRHRVLSDVHCQDLIRWADTSDSFFGLFYFSFLFLCIKFLIVLDHERFAREILLRWFKHQNFASFARPPLWHWRNQTLDLYPWELPQRPLRFSVFDSPKKRKLATALAPEGSELLDREAQCSQKIGGHYGSTFK